MNWIGKRVRITYQKPDGKIQKYYGKIIRLLDLAIIVELDNRNKTFFYFKDIKRLEEVDA